jgi:hypothetical protein
MLLQRQPAQLAHDVNATNDLGWPDSHCRRLIRKMPDGDADYGHVSWLVWDKKLGSQVAAVGARVVIRSKDVGHACGWLSTQGGRRLLIGRVCWGDRVAIGRTFVEAKLVLRGTSVLQKGEAVCREG